MTSMTEIPGKCPVCELKPVKNCHYGAFVCKNCAQMFKRNFFRQDLVCRKDQQYCRAGCSHPCPKCRLDRCFQVGLKSGLIAVPEFRLNIGDKMAQKENFQIICEMVQLYNRIKKSIIDKSDLDKQPEEYTGFITNIFINRGANFAAKFQSIQMLFNHVPVFSVMPKGVLSRFTEKFFYYYIILVHTWSIIGFTRTFQLYHTTTDLLFLNPSTFVNFGSIMHALTSDELSWINASLKTCTSIGIKHRRTWNSIEACTVFLLALVKMAQRHCDREDLRKKIDRMEWDIVKEFECYSDNNAEVLSGIFNYVEELEKTVRHFEAVKIRLNQHFVSKPVCQKPNLAINPALIEIPFYLDGYSALEIPSQSSAFRSFVPGLASQ